MKFQITMKDPDGPYECIQDAATDSLTQISGLSEEERETLKDQRVGQLRTFADKWMKYGEYITVEFDTEAGTAVVVPER
jgi:hypothetical protein